MPGKGGDPQAYRSISRELKRGRKGEELLGGARSIHDPYYRALALAEIGLKGAMHEGRAEHILEEALKEAASVASEWRRGELLGELLHQAVKIKDTKKKSQLSRGALEVLRGTPPGHGLSEGIKSCSKSADGKMGKELLRMAQGNKGFELENGKAVIKALFRHNGPTPDDVMALERTLLEGYEPLHKALLLSYLYFQLEQASRKEEAERVFRSAFSLLSELKDQELLQAFNDLARKTSSKGSSELLLERARSDQDPYTSVKMLSVTADALDRLGDRDGARALMATCLERTELVSLQRRAEVLASCSNAFKRLGDNDSARRVADMALDLSKDDGGASAKVQYLLGKDERSVKEDGPMKVGAVKGPNNHILALLDTYEGRLGPVHLRALARAAPLCQAFSLDLALIGFPTDDLERLLKLSINETSVGEEGRYIRELSKEGRIHLVRTGKDVHGSIWSALGMPVATTPHPDRSKAVDMERAVMLSRSHPTGRVCLIMGLGKRGLPPSLLRSVPHHLELTGSNISLETATAMGIMAYMLHISSRR